MLSMHECVTQTVSFHYKLCSARSSNHSLVDQVLTKSLKMVQQVAWLVTVVAVSFWIGLSEAGTVPTGCVKIRSYYNNMYLSRSNSMYSDDRQHVALTSTETSWTMVKEEDYYRIQNPGSPTQELYTGSATFDDERRYVFLWTGSDSISESKWIIRQMTNGRYLIRSRNLDELLHTSANAVVYTWQKSINPYEDEKFHWQITAC